MMKLKAIWFSAVVCCSALMMQAANAFEVEQVQARFQDQAYQLTMTAVMAAPLAKVTEVLRDYDHYPQLDAHILAAQVLARPAPNQVELFTRINVCFTFICRKVERVERVEETPSELRATIIPERSDAERGSTRTQLVAEGDRTRVLYTTEIVPKFWVPTWPGHSMMLRTLREATISMFQHVEARAAVLPDAPVSAP